MNDLTKNVYHKKPGSTERSYHIEIDAISQRHLRFFMDNELRYYNALVNNVTMRLRAFPEEVVTLREGFGKLWSTLAFTNKNLRDFTKKEVSAWPKNISSTVPTSAIKNGKFVVEDKKMMLFDSLVVQGDIHPQMRKHMASEVLSYILPQADQLVAAQKNPSGQMRDPVHMLTPKSYPERRHIQLTKDLIKMTYNKELDQTEIVIPYTDRPLIVKDHNLKDEKFNLILIRQQPNVSVSAKTPWQVDLMITNHNYLLDVTDQNMYSKRRRAA